MAPAIVVQTQRVFCLKIFQHLSFLEKPFLLQHQASLASR